MHFVENLIAEVQRDGRSKGVSPARGRICTAWHDQLDLSVVQARKAPCKLTTSFPNLLILSSEGLFA